MIARTELGHLERADGNAIEVLGVLAQPAIGQVQGEFAIGLFAHQFRELLDMLGKGATLAPERDVPFGRHRLGGKGNGQRGGGRCGQHLGHVVLPN